MPDGGGIAGQKIFDYSIRAAKPGETLESAVRRECAEETGVSIDEVGYVASQPWPFPASIMFGFRARAKSFDLAARDDELADVQWFTRDDVRGFGERSDPGEGFKLPNRTAIARHLIEGWLSE